MGARSRWRRLLADDARQQVHHNGEAEEEDDDRNEPWVVGHGEPPGSTLQRYPVSASAISRSIAGRRASAACGWVTRSRLVLPAPLAFDAVLRLRLGRALPLHVR